MLKNSDQIYRNTIALINGIRNEQILILTGQYALKVSAANALYLACLGAGRVDITGRLGAKCSALYAASLTALTVGHNDKLDEIKEKANKDLEEAGIVKIQRDALIEGNAQRRRMDALLQYWDDLAQALEDYRDCLDEQESEEDQELENQD